MRVQASKHKKLEESLQKMSARTKLIFDQCVMKANTKSAKAARRNKIIFQTLKENVTWLNKCCDYIESLPKQRQACFLTKPTSEALRVTLLSTIALVENLLASGFRYVLVGNFGQDPLEVNM
ncbi:hypothetical protein HPB48_024360 [Haemaphysalis longicornis]|uniref:Uncharacterized protein n=1 Tax=Haemaphysalis longicornis TaxID=44386 RepID=A0A9J6H6J8_HAELO|nr:hypothetical protein HPB48_024360 [Haemaphysalis longicornis]